MVICLESLPKDLLVEISSRVGASSLSAVRNLSLVSKSFGRICDHRDIFHRVSLQDVPLFPWNHNPEKFSNFYKRCWESGNPEVLYRKGLINFFLDNLKHEGLSLLAEAAEQENQEAQYIYGLILICNGGEEKEKGFKILSSVTNQLMSKTMEELVDLRHKIKEKIWWRGRPAMGQLKRAYIREQ